MSLHAGNNAIDAIAFSSWNFFVNTPGAITYSFLTEIPFDESTTDDRNGFLPLNATQQNEVRSALAQWASVANLTFTEIQGGGGNLGQIRIGSNNQGRESSGYSDLPSNTPDVPVYTYFSHFENGATDFRPGSYDLTVFLHELGHALGLKHPGNYNGNSGSGTPPFLPAETDTTDYTLMSYNESNATNSNLYPSTPMLLDIQAIQFIYGANTSWHTGNDVYTFTNGSAPQSIWDAGGSNTFDFSATTDGATIDLRAGAFSETRPGANNVSIAYNVTINTAIGGSGDDNIRANNNGNTLSGGDGNDFFYLGTGRDTVEGGAGTDKLSFSGLSTDYQIARSGSGFSIANRTNANDVDFARNVESFVFSDNVEIQASAIGIGSNHAPQVASTIRDIYAGANKAFSLQVASAFNDIDANDVLRFTATQSNGQPLPGWLQFNGGTGTFSGTPNGGQLGNTSITVTALDANNATASTSFHLSTISNFGTHFNNTNGSDTFNGSSSAIDDVVYNGNRSDFTIRSTAGTNVNLTSSYTITQGNVTDTLVGVDRIRFNDAIVALDISGHGGQAYGLYQAAFNRTPDLGGLGYWINALDIGYSLSFVADTFITSPEFVSTYSTLNNADFVNLVYVNVLHRNSDAGGSAFWQQNLNNHVISRADLLLNFTTSAEFQGNLAASVGNGFVYTPFLG